MKLNSMLGALYDEPLLLEPISRTPTRMSIFSSIPFIGSNGVFALYDYHPLISFAAPAGLREPSPPTPRYASPEGLPAPKKNLGNYMKNLSSRAYRMIRRTVGHVADYAVPERISATNAYGAPEISTVNNVPLPLGGIRAEQFPGIASINLEPNTIPGTHENRILKSLYKSALNFVRKRRNHFGENGKKLEKFYERTIENLSREPLVDIVHEYVHQMLERLGINLKCNKNEAATTYITDRIMKRSSTTPGTSYHTLKKMGRYIFNKLGMSPECAVEKAEYDSTIGPKIVKIFDKYWQDAYKKVA